MDLLRASPLNAVADNNREKESSIYQTHVLNSEVTREQKAVHKHTLHIAI